MTLDTQKPVLGQARPRIFCRWWLRSRYAVIDGGIHGGELYVPWWAWPFELLHRVIFGAARIDIQK